MRSLASQLLVIAAVAALSACQSSPTPQPFALAIHGGAGTILREDMSATQESEYRQTLEQALRTGHGVLEAGGSSIDAVVATLLVLENSPLFNAGRGAVFTADATCELDASIMDGATGQAGSVAGVTTVKNPILAARAVMDDSDHVMLAGTGADRFAHEVGLEIVPNAYFHTERRRAQLERALGPQARADGTPDGEDRHGTVGAVALDRDGHLAAGTSTGGMTAKRWGRVGDSPVIGAGTWADGRCAISGTGWGEFFLRGAVAHDIAALMAYGGLNLADAGHRVVVEKLTEAGGTGGVISMDAEGRVSAPFNTPGMYRGWIDAAGRVEVHIWHE